MDFSVQKQGELSISMNNPQALKDNDKTPFRLNNNKKISTYPFLWAFLFRVC